MARKERQKLKISLPIITLPPLFPQNREVWRSPTRILEKKEINLAVKKARRREERRTKAQVFFNRPLKRMKGGRGGARVTVRKGIKSLWDLI